MNLHTGHRSWDSSKSLIQESSGEGQHAWVKWRVGVLEAVNVLHDGASVISSYLPIIRISNYLLNHGSGSQVEISGMKWGWYLIYLIPLVFRTVSEAKQFLNICRYVMKINCLWLKKLLVYVPTFLQIINSLRLCSQLS